MPIIKSDYAYIKTWMLEKIRVIPIRFKGKLSNILMLFKQSNIFLIMQYSDGQWVYDINPKMYLPMSLYITDDKYIIKVWL